MILILAICMRREQSTGMQSVEFLQKVPEEPKEGYEYNKRSVKGCGDRVGLRNKHV